MTTLDRSLAEAAAGQLETFEFKGSLGACLNYLWNPPEPSPTSADRTIDEDDESDIYFSRAEPERSEWTLAFTPTFKRSIASVDRKLQGRMLAAVSDLSSEPVKVHGDTVKPLTGEFKGLWRYRLGDYRLIYKPTLERKHVVLLEFSSRGGAYE